MSPSSDCVLYAYSRSLHVTQLYAGFSMLAARGVVRLRQELRNHPVARDIQPHLPPHRFHGLFVSIDDRQLVFYDMTDYAELELEVLRAVDVYFKRSYRAESVPEKARSKVFPLGLNYEVYPDHGDHFEAARVVLRPQPIGDARYTWMRSLALLLGLRWRPTVSRISSPPSVDQEPKALFFARAWNPDGTDPIPTGVPMWGRDKVEAINEVRAKTIRLLRRELGTRFVGGLVRDAFSVVAYPDVVCEDTTITRRAKYLELVRRTPICVASTGLHDSNGWKLGEYVALSRAIVSEVVRHEVPYGFQEGDNYLQFMDADGCAERCVALMEDSDLRLAMMQKNWDYYRTYLAPDCLIAASLKIAGSLKP